MGFNKRTTLLGAAVAAAVPVILTGIYLMADEVLLKQKDKDGHTLSLSRPV